MNRNGCVYFVEGFCEKTLIDALKEKPALIAPGRTKVFNAISHELTVSHANYHPKRNHSRIRL